jgi:hypothetical protein
MTPFVTGGAGFLLAVLWFDLMFDVQVLRQRSGDLPDDALASISAYYRRVTTTARPMNRLVGVVMLGTIGSAATALAKSDVPNGVAAVSLALLVAPVALAASHTFPAARRLGLGRDASAEQSRLARAICRDHLVCLGCIVSVLVLQLALAR